LFVAQEKFMKKNIIALFILSILLNACIGSSTTGIFGSGVSIALDPRTLGTQIDDSIMQKNLQARLILHDKKYFIKVSVKVLDGRIFLGGKVDEPEEKLKITKMAWETNGARSVKNNIEIKKKFSFKNTAIDILITSQLKAALILNKNVKASNFNIDTVNQKTYIFGIAQDENEKKEIIQEAKQIVDLKELVSSILFVSDLSRQKE
tara:strand:- start:1656 stop:2273 length:618 start_codon:yes stop_codon:yes gene_type:complete